MPAVRRTYNWGIGFDCTLDIFRVITNLSGRSRLFLTPMLTMMTFHLIFVMLPSHDMFQAALHTASFVEHNFPFKFFATFTHYFVAVSFYQNKVIFFTSILNTHGIYNYPTFPLHKVLLFSASINCPRSWTKTKTINEQRQRKAQLHCFVSNAVMVMAILIFT